MENSQISNQKIIRVSDILEQIDELNKMIELNKNSENDSMLKQYQYMRDEFIQELRTILHEFQIKVQAA